MCRLLFKKIVFEDFKAKCCSTFWHLFPTLRKKVEPKRLHPGAVLENGVTFEGGAVFESGTKIVPWVELSYVP